MTKQESKRRTHLAIALDALGFTEDEQHALRRISNTLHNWYELECGTGEGQVSRSVERQGEDGTGKPFMRIQYPNAAGWVDKRYPIADRETGARKRLAGILQDRNVRMLPLQSPDKLFAYIQTDPRGAALYILRPGDVPEGEEPSAYYSRGICVY